MAVATSLPIKLSDVCLEIYGSSSTSGRTLNTCFTDATGTFDATYEGSKDRLQNFRGYANIVVSPLSVGIQNVTEILRNFTVINYNTPTTDITVRYTLLSISSSSGYVTIDGTNLTTVNQTKDVSDTNLGSLQEPMNFNNTGSGDTASVKCEVISSTLAGTTPTDPTFMTASWLIT